MLQNEWLLAKFGADTGKYWPHIAKQWETFCDTSGKLAILEVLAALSAPAAGPPPPKPRLALERPFVRVLELRKEGRALGLVIEGPQPRCSGFKYFRY